MMKRRLSHAFCSFAGVAVSLISACALVLGTASPASANTVGLVGGGAYGEQLAISLLVPVSSGPAPVVTLPPTGGSFTANAANVNLPGVLSVALLTASTQGVLGTSGFVTSSSTLTTVNALNGSLVAQVIGSSCHIDANGVETGTFLTGATLLGAPLNVSPAPNTTLPLAGLGSVTLNEQTSSVGPLGNRMITVNGVHIRLNGALGVGAGDIILAHSACTARI